MSWSMLGRWEWILIEAIVLALAIWELVSVRRAIRRSKTASTSNETDPPA